MLAIGLVYGALAACCGGRDAHFMTDKTYRKQVEADFSSRPDHVGGDVAIFDKTGRDLYNGEALSKEEREALTFLYAYMPLADAVDYPAEYFLDQVEFNRNGLGDCGEKTKIELIPYGCTKQRIASFPVRWVKEE